MHIHILGICGTFMAGVAALARESGLRVSGSDAGAWPPMSTQLERLGIEVRAGYDPAHIDDSVDLVVVGNVISRGNPAIEHVLDQRLPYVSGPQWLGEQVLAGRHVLAVAGTHGKTTTASLLAWLLEAAGLEPGFLIGGVPLDFGVSARLGGGEVFVVEADEYDPAFFDKRSKFVHYRPTTAILNNLEFDHADIFDDLAAIERQFHHLVRTVPGNGRLIVNGRDAALARVLEQGCWTPVETFGSADGWHLREVDGTATLYRADDAQGVFRSPMAGAHNRANAVAAVAAASAAGASMDRVLDALPRFASVRRRLEHRGEAAGVAVYDDFAHHPTAVAETIAGLREIHAGRIVAVMEPRSNTMRRGVHAAQLLDALDAADRAWIHARADLDWSPDADGHPALAVAETVEALIDAVVAERRPGDAVLVMSNGDFEGIHERLLTALSGAGGQ